MNPVPQCLVSLDGTPLRFINFDPYQDKMSTVALLEKERARLNAELSSRLPKTGAYLTNCSKKIKILDLAIVQFSPDPSSAYIEKPTSRKDKRIRKKLRRKATRQDRLRK